MKLSVFIRTYNKDFDWLEYSLMSIKKYIKYDELVIITPHEQELLYRLETEFEIFKVIENCNGYLAQQVDKLKAHHYCTGDAIIYVDSDTIFHTPVNIETFITDGKIDLLRTLYSKIETPWQEITEKAIGFRSDWEYMRRMPMVYWRDTLHAINNAFPHIYKYIEQQPGHHFSEFNFIGQFIERFETHRYNLNNTDDGLPPEYCKQFWSWGGITPEIRKEMEGLING